MAEQCIREIDILDEDGVMYDVARCPNEGTEYHDCQIYGLAGFIVHLCPRHSFELEAALNHMTVEEFRDLQAGLNSRRAD